MKFNDRILAIVLLDIIGSTAFVERYGARKSAEWLQYHDRLTRSLLYKFSGREIDRSDGFMLSFDRPIDAVNFCLHYQNSIPKKTRLQTRIGVHWGKVVEVTQDELYVGVGAKRIELEGVAKNITARTMSICRAGQVLLTKEAMIAVKSRTNAFTPNSTRYACIGLYKFKGVKSPQQLYSVGTSIESLQPPTSNDKVKRLGGAKKIKSRMRDKKLREHLVWLINRLALVSFIYLLALTYPMLSNPSAREMWGLDECFFWYDYIDLIKNVVKQAYQGVLEDIGVNSGRNR
jgi:class 3 adenylate cyclase